MTRNQRIGVERDSSRLRKHVCELFGASDPEAVILAPGILSGLQVLFAKLGVRRILLTDHEYYSKAHFPAAQVAICKPERLFLEAEKRRPDAILSSLVSWNGRTLPVASQFAAIRKRDGRHAPLLVTDYTHAGAIGFPPMKGLHADIVVGDFVKWVTPPRMARYVSFSWMANRRLRDIAVETFRPFFLATRQAEPLASRWVPSWELKELLEWIESERINRKYLMRQFAANRELAEQVACALGLERPSNCIVWATKLKKHPLLESLTAHDLVWNTGEGFRIRCRAEWLSHNGPGSTDHGR